MMRRKQIESYCTCGHKLTSHMLQEDVTPDGKAEATCCRCDCTFFYYDSALSHDKEQEAYDRYIDQKIDEWRDRRYDKDG